MPVHSSVVSQALVCAPEFRLTGCFCCLGLDCDTYTEESKRSVRKPRKTLLESTTKFQNADRKGYIRTDEPENFQVVFF